MSQPPHTLYKDQILGSVNPEMHKHQEMNYAASFEIFSLTFPNYLQ
jgi:hypothetical protein